MSSRLLGRLFPGFAEQRLQTEGTEINLVTAGKGPPLLLLHGWPQNLVMWHKVAPLLVEKFTVVAADLRGYGQSGKPPAGEGQVAYSKRALALDQVEVMQALGFDSFFVAGHDRGARVAHRMALDHPDKVERLMLLDILPTHYLLRNTDMHFARVYWHWFFMMQPAPVPETLLGNSAEFFLQGLARMAGEGGFAPEVLASYQRTFTDADTLHATCNEYRAGGGIDLDHDDADYGNRKIECPLRVLWAAMNELYQAIEPLTVWREYADSVEGKGLASHHFIPEQVPLETVEEMTTWFGA